MKGLKTVLSLAAALSVAVDGVCGRHGDQRVDAVLPIAQAAAEKSWRRTAA
jgi:hypothetical protein